MRDSRPTRPTGPGRPTRPRLTAVPAPRPPDDTPPPGAQTSQPWTDAEVAEVLHIGLEVGLAIAAARIWQPFERRQAA